MLFGKRRVEPFNLTTDIHSHIIPGIDDGSQELETSLTILKGLKALGIEKIWLTPHVKENIYPNTFESVSAAFEKFKDKVSEAGIDMEMEAAAEYYIGPRFLKLLESGERLLTMKDQFILVEVSMGQEPLFVFDTLFSIEEKGYTPILAHPERYKYYHGRKDIYDKLKKHGCMFQMNLFSVAGYYGKDVKSIAMELLKDGYYDFTATDIHNVRHLEILNDRNVRKILNEYNFKNDILK